MRVVSKFDVCVCGYVCVWTHRLDLSSSLYTNTRCLHANLSSPLSVSNHLPLKPQRLACLRAFLLDTNRCVFTSKYTVCVCVISCLKLCVSFEDYSTLQLATECYCTLLLLTATVHCNQSLLLLTATTHCYYSLLLLTATVQCYCSLFLLTATAHCDCSLLLRMLLLTAGDTTSSLLWVQWVQRVQWVQWVQWVLWVQWVSTVSTSEYKWVQVSTSEYKWVQVITSEYKWVQVSTVSTSILRSSSVHLSSSSVHSLFVCS
jgi:hypothetical protein